MEAEILVVDEVLAVGDVAFQRKCLGKMEEISTGGRTVLFVSHQMAAVQNLCSTGLLLSEGRLKARGPIGEVVAQYLRETSSLARVSLADRIDRQGTGAIRFTGVNFQDASGRNVNALTSGAAVVLQLQLTPRDYDLRNVRIGFGVDNDNGQRILGLSSHLTGDDLTLPAEIDSIELYFPRLGLSPGRYAFTLFASVNGEVVDWIKQAGTFDVEEGDFYGTGRLPDQGQGHFVMDHEFRLGSICGPDSERRDAARILMS
jgi:lipopolysaccharide transport system ATP-binding protein